MVTLYSNDCPRCKILKKKLDEKGVNYESCTDVNKMLSLGITTVPMLRVEDKMMGFSEAVKWVSEKGD
mgnify:CR=1 FL=1